MPLTYRWRDAAEQHEMRMVPVPGTGSTPFLFGTDPDRRPISIPDFHLASTPVTQALWTLIMGSNPSERVAPRGPVENVAFPDITGPGEFLDRINASEIRRALAGDDDTLAFRLPSESEWEYAARGGPQWKDEFIFSGSNDATDVAWFGPHWSRLHRAGMRLLGPRLGWRILSRQNRYVPTRTHDVAAKAPNQLGLYDMSGNVWEWCEDSCEDTCTDAIDAVPLDGSPWRGPGRERRLRGGCHHSWDIHCTVSKRYGIEPDAHDGCIGFRIALGRPWSQPSS